MKWLWFFALIFECTIISFSQTSCKDFKKCTHKYHLSKTGANDNLRSDTIDIIEYKIVLDITDFTTDTIYSSCKISFKGKISGLNTLSLDLLKMSVDSIKNNNTSTSFSYNDTLLVIDLLNIINSGDSGEVEVYYHGVPQQDVSGWGGWYQQSDYSYNLGVGFAADPHNYGRVWHPCFDNFIERATYEIEIITDNGRSAYSNGILLDTITLNGKLHSIWEMKTPIPTYLATVAVSQYTHVRQNYISAITTDTTPVYLIAKPSDTTSFKNSFINLFGAMGIFENEFGPYLWDKIGYYLVPFSGGAMEHATAIAYPRATINGSTNYETLMAHELSHHWWGNLVTCRTDEDMWINEGLASYSEFLFLEGIYGHSDYLEEVKANHLDVLHHAHINDNGYFSLHGIPHSVTYGDHSYNKGADVMHTLRSYIGDTNFFNGLKSILNSYYLQDIDAYDFRNELNTLSGVNVTPFFNDWILGKGFPHFSIDSLNTSPNGLNFDMNVYIKQKLKGTIELFDSVPLTITFVDQDWSTHTANFIMSGELNMFTFSLPFEAQWAYLNGNDEISQAVTGENIIINSTGNKNLPYSMSNIITNSITDSSMIRIEHHWASPDDFKDHTKYFMYELSQERYWSVNGDLSNNSSTTMRLFFNGTSSSNGNLDNDLTGLSGFHEDSIQLFYRKNTANDWKSLQLATLQTLGSPTDGYGFVEIDTIMIGEYTWGWKKSNVGFNETSSGNWIVYPNPSLNDIYINVPSSGSLTIYDMQGRNLKGITLKKGANHIDLPKEWKGVYVFVYKYLDEKKVKKIVLE